MLRGLLHKVSFIGLAIIALGAHRADAQTVAPGPYYAVPSWDMTLPAATRFIVLSNFGSAAVLDRETGLVWERSPDTTTDSWFIAQNRCNGKIVGSRKGWRLPTLQELNSLIDPTASSPALPDGHPFSNVQLGRYWSLSTYALDNTFAWTVAFDNGATGLNNKGTLSLFIWCVRGGQGVNP
jgi:Protein of unknown function (DUF1566)